MKLYKENYAAGKKQKGIAKVKMDDGFITFAELHWYEAHGLGKFEFKISYYLEDIEV